MQFSFFLTCSLSFRSSSFPLNNLRIISVGATSELSLLEKTICFLTLSSSYHPPSPFPSPPATFSSSVSWSSGPKKKNFRSTRQIIKKNKQSQKRHSLYRLIINSFQNDWLGTGRQRTREFRDRILASFLSTTNPVSTRRVDSSFFVFSLSSHRYSYKSSL